MTSKHKTDLFNAKTIFRPDTLLFIWAWIGLLCLALFPTEVNAATATVWSGNVGYLAKAMKATVSLVRMFSALLAVIMGAWVAIKWKHAGQQAQGELINYLVMLFFLFGATLFIDAVIAVTVGKFSFVSSGNIAKEYVGNENPRWMFNNYSGN